MNIECYIILILAILLIVYLFVYYKDGKDDKEDKEQINNTDITYTKIPIRHDDTYKFIPEYQNIFSAYPWYNKVTPLPWNNPTSLFTGY